MLLDTPLRHVFHHAVETLFPARCPVCRQSVASQGALCAACWQQMDFLEDPRCHRCGVPFTYEIGFAALCGGCMRKTPPYTQARAVFRYSTLSKSQILAFKYQDKTQLAPVFGAWLARSAQGFSSAADIIVPVPLHWRRLFMRRYNQASLLAYAVAEHLNLPVFPDLLRRRRATTPQAGLSRTQRERNMRGAFYVSPRQAFLLRGMSVLLVDDVMTTGATLEACARILRDAGAKDIFVLTLARTTLEEGSWTAQYQEQLA